MNSVASSDTSVHLQTKPVNSQNAGNPFWKIVHCSSTKSEMTCREDVDRQNCPSSERFVALRQECYEKPTRDHASQGEVPNVGDTEHEDREGDQRPRADLVPPPWSLL